MTPEQPTPRGIIAVDKMGGKVLFLNPSTYETEVVLEGFPRTVHELLALPETDRAYVPIFGDGIHGRNPNPHYLLCVFDLAKRTHIGDIDLRPYMAPHTLKLGPHGFGMASGSMCLARADGEDGCSGYARSGPFASSRLLYGFSFSSASALPWASFSKSDGDTETSLRNFRPFASDA
jgi:hypothetical protein